MRKAVFLLLCFHFSVSAQENIYDILGMDMVDSSDYEGKIMFYEELPFNLLNKGKVDKKVEKEVAPSKQHHFRTLGDLNAFLVKNKKSEYEKVRSFFVWIVKNIEFDVQSYNNNHYSPQHPLVIYQTRRALPKGFADLFTILCQNNDIECRSLKGYTKGFDEQKEKKKYPSHYWNVVRIDNYWYLIDIPMCIGKVITNEFVHNYREDFFLPTPAEFSKSHLPIHASWQLIEKQISYDDFYK